MSRYGYGGFPPYVSVAERKLKAAKEVQKLKKKGKDIQPIVIEGKSITDTFWGKAWCKNLEAYSDYDNRLPRGRSYVRNGSVIDLNVKKGEINALVQGSSIYKVKISIHPITKDKWKAIVKECVGKIDSLIELLQGKFSKAVMEIITDPKKGLFPHPKDIKLNCSCPDWADMCKHVAAVLYGIGARLDKQPEELFNLRQANHIELISKAGTRKFTHTVSAQDDQVLSGNDLSSLFGIEIEGSKSVKSKQKKTLSKKSKITKKPTKKKAKTKIAVC